MIGAGYLQSEIWAMTPRRLCAFLELARARERRQRADTLFINGTAAGAPYMKKGELKKMADKLRDGRED